LPNSGLGSGGAWPKTLVPTKNYWKEFLTNLKLLRGIFVTAFHRNKKIIILGFLVFGRFENESFLK